MNKKFGIESRDWVNDQKSKLPQIKIKFCIFMQANGTHDIHLFTNNQKHKINARSIEEQKK